jgi:hypothetical protein
MKLIKKGWLLATGVITSGLGFLGLGLCCLPVVGGITSLLGISVLFFHQVSQWLLGFGLLLLLFGLIILLRRQKGCCK